MATETNYEWALDVAVLLLEELDARPGMRPHERPATAPYLIPEAARAGRAVSGRPTAPNRRDDAS